MSSPPKSEALAREGNLVKLYLLAKPCPIMSDYVNNNLLILQDLRQVFASFS